MNTRVSVLIIAASVLAMIARAGGACAGVAAEPQQPERPYVGE
jgi:hypothetical protein